MGEKMTNPFTKKKSTAEISIDDILFKNSISSSNTIK